MIAGVWRGKPKALLGDIDLGVPVGITRSQNQHGLGKVKSDALELAPGSEWFLRSQPNYCEGTLRCSGRAATGTMR